MKTLNTKEELKDFLKDIPEDAIVNIDRYNCFVTWSPVSLSASCSNGEETGPKSYHGGRAKLAEDLVKLLH